MIWPRALAFAVLISSSVAAQQPGSAPESMKGAVLKGRAPVNDEVLKLTLPRPVEADLPNGLHLMVLEDHRVPSVSFQILIPGAGGYYDPGDMPGLAEFTASLMREGTATRTSPQIAEQLETMAANVSVSTASGSQIATVSGSSLSENFDRVLELATDILLHPSFPEEELARYKVRARAGLVQQRSNPNFLARELFSRVMYGSHPAGRVGPTPESLQRAMRDTLVAVHRANYVPDYAIVGVSGDITMAEARKKFEAALGVPSAAAAPGAPLGGWAKSGKPRSAVTDPDAPPGAKVYVINRPESVQTTLVVGAPAISRTSPDYDIVAVMNKIIGGGPTGRLFLNLREDKGYTYGASSGVSALRYRGHWEAATDVRSEVTEPALRELMGELVRIRDVPVPDKEFRDAKRSMVAAFALSLESPGAILQNHLTRWLYDLPLDYWDRYPERITAVTREQVQAAARKYLDPSRLQVVAVGDGSKIGDLLKKFGAVETYDTEGKKVSN